MYGLFYVDSQNQKIECLNRYDTYKAAISNLLNQINTYIAYNNWNPPINIYLTNEFNYASISQDSHEQGYWIEISPDKSIVYFKKYKGSWLYSPQIDQIGYFQILSLPTFTPNKNLSQDVSKKPQFVEVVDKPKPSSDQIYSNLLIELKSAIANKNPIAKQDIDQFIIQKKSLRSYDSAFLKNLQLQKTQLKSSPSP